MTIKTMARSGAFGGESIENNAEMFKITLSKFKWETTNWVLVLVIT